MIHRVLVFITALLVSMPLLRADQARERGVSVPTQDGDAQRESWQRVPDVLAAIGAAPGAVIADIGAGDGFFTTRLARAVGPTGKVFAVDISESALDRLGRRLTSEQISNVEAILGLPADPRLPAGVLDAALVVNAYHEMTEHQAMLDAIGRALKPTGRLLILESIVEAQRALPRATQANRHQLAPHFVQRDVIDAGFYITRYEDAFTRRASGNPEFLLVATLVPAAGASDARQPSPAGAPGATVERQLAEAGFRLGRSHGFLEGRFFPALPRR